MIKFTVPGVPVPKARARVTRINGVSRTYTPEKTVRYENTVAYYASEAMKKEPIPVYQPGIALAMKLLIFLEPPKSWSKKRKDYAYTGFIYPTSKPDADNICKSISDALNDIVYTDDSQIVDYIISKRYSEEPRVEIEIIELYPL